MPSERSGGQSNREGQDYSWLAGWLASLTYDLGLQL